MSLLKNIVLIGASGQLGSTVLKALVDSSKFNITILSRTGSTSTFPPSLKVLHADYTSVDSLTTAFKGQDAVVSLVGTPGFQGQTAFVDAAIAAGVKRFLPSEFGSDLSNPVAASLPVFGYKVQVRKYIEEKIKNGANLSYTYIVNGPFLDWGLKVGFLLAWQSGKPTIYGSGDQVFTSTTLYSVGQGIAGVLTHPEETKNRQVNIGDIELSQNKLLEIAKKAASEKTASWTPVSKPIAEIDTSVIVNQLFLSIFGEGNIGRLEKTENELLGLKGKTEEDVEEIWKSILA